jgi:hypothetical protein
MGIVMILVAIVIVAILGKEALKGYGLAFGGAATKNAGTPAQRARAPGAGGVEALDLGSAPEVPASTLERARGVEDMLKQQADKRDARMESQTK